MTLTSLVLGPVMLVTVVSGLAGSDPATNAIMQQSSTFIVDDPLMRLMHSSDGHLVLMACCATHSGLKSEISHSPKLQSPHNKMNLLF